MDSKPNTAKSSSGPADADDVALAPVAPATEDTAELAAAAPEVAEVVEAPADVTDPVDGDDVNVIRLRALLADLKEKLTKKGNDPKNFAAAAKVNSQLTKLLIHMPKVPMLDVYLTFLQQNADGVAKRETFLSGSTTLGSTDQNEVGTLYSLFMDLVDGNLVRVNNSQITQILKKPEFAAYYARKVSVFAQQKRQANA